MRRISPLSSAIGRKAPGASRPVHRMLPADERLDRRDAAGGEVVDRLVDEDQLVALEALPELALERDALLETFAEPVVEDLDAPAAELLGAVHRQVGVAEHALGAAIAVCGDGDADRAGERVLLALQVGRERGARPGPRRRS